MRNIALERDDSIVPITTGFSIAFHALLFFLVVLPRMEQAAAMEHVYGTAHQVLAVPQRFAQFSSVEKIFTESQEGLAAATSGDVRVDPELLRPESSRNAHGRSAPDELQTVTSRINHGQQSNEVSREVAQAESRNGGISGPAMPTGNIVFNEVDRPVESSGTANPAGDRSALRLGAAPSAMAARRGDATPRQSLSQPAPQSGRTDEHRAWTEPVSMGPNVAETLEEGPRPTVTPAAPRAGTRRNLYMPVLKYPEWALRDNVRGTPIFDITVGSDGRVSSARLAKTTGFPALDRLAEEAVRQWIFEPLPGQTEVRRAVVEFKL